MATRLVAVCAVSSGVGNMSSQTMPFKVSLYPPCTLIP